MATHDVERSVSEKILDALTVAVVVVVGTAFMGGCVLTLMDAGEYLKWWIQL